SARELLDGGLVLAEPVEQLNGCLHLFRRSLPGEWKAEQPVAFLALQDLACYVRTVNSLHADPGALEHLGTKVLPQNLPILTCAHTIFLHVNRRPNALARHVLGPGDEKNVASIYSLRDSTEDLAISEAVFFCDAVCHRLSYFVVCGG